MSGHTPGPWRVGTQIADHDSIAVVGSNLVQSDGGTICAVMGVASNMTRKAIRESDVPPVCNARLISAAPLLLAACKAMLATALKCDDMAWVAAIEKADSHRPCEQARAAILAAEGGAK